MILERTYPFAGLGGPALASTLAPVRWKKGYSPKSASYMIFGGGFPGLGDPFNSSDLTESVSGKDGVVDSYGTSNLVLFKADGDSDDHVPTDLFYPISPPLSPSVPQNPTGKVTALLSLQLATDVYAPVQYYYPTRVYVGGEFTAIANSTVNAAHVALLLLRVPDASAPNVRGTWYPLTDASRNNCSGLPGPVLAFAEGVTTRPSASDKFGATTVYVGGVFSTLCDLVTRATNIAAWTTFNDDPTRGTWSALSPLGGGSVDTGPPSPVRALAFIANSLGSPYKLFVGGDFGLLRVLLPTLANPSYVPQWTSAKPGVLGAVYALTTVANQASVFIGGAFTTLDDGAVANNVAVWLDYKNGGAGELNTLPTRTAGVSGINDAVFTITYSGNGGGGVASYMYDVTMFFGGNFTALGNRGDNRTLTPGLATMPLAAINPGYAGVLQPLCAKYKLSGCAGPSSTVYTSAVFTASDKDGFSGEAERNLLSARHSLARPSRGTHPLPQPPQAQPCS